MQQTARMFFIVADITVGASLLGAVYAVANEFFAALDYVFGPGVQFSWAVAGIGLLVFLAVVAVAAVYVFACVLHFRRNVIGPLILIAFGVFNIVYTLVLPPPNNAFLWILTYLLHLTLVGLPWALTWFDLKRRGLLAKAG